MAFPARIPSEDAADKADDIREGPKPLPDTVCDHYREHKPAGVAGMLAPSELVHL